MNAVQGVKNSGTLDASEPKYKEILSCDMVTIEEFKKFTGDFVRKIENENIPVKNELSKHLCVTLLALCEAHVCFLCATLCNYRQLHRVAQRSHREPQRQVIC